MKPNILIIVLGVIFLSCDSSSGTAIFENTKSKMEISNISTTSDFVQLESIHLNNYPIHTFLNKGDIDYLIGYNFRTHSLDIFNLPQKNIESVPLHGDGPDAIKRDVNGIYSNSPDSIWLYASKTVYLLNNDGTINQKYNLPVDADEEIVNATNYSNSTIQLHYNPVRNSIFYITMKMDYVDEYYANEFLLDAGTANKRLLEYTDADDEIGKKYGWIQHPNVTYNANLVIYNFPFNSNVYLLNIDSGKISKHGGKSTFTENFSNMANVSSIEGWDRLLIENVHFYEVNYDPFRNCYYRIHLNGLEFNPKISFPDQLYNKNFYLTIFDDQLNVIEEIALTQNSYNFMGGWGVVKDGFLIIKENPNNLNTNYQELQYDIISLTFDSRK